MSIVRLSRSKMSSTLAFLPLRCPYRVDIPLWRPTQALSAPMRWRPWAVQVDEFVQGMMQVVLVGPGGLGSLQGQGSSGVESLQQELHGEAILGSIPAGEGEDARVVAIVANGEAHRDGLSDRVHGSNQRVVEDPFSLHERRVGIGF
jgi:hypothetical protein